MVIRSVGSGDEFAVEWCHAIRRSTAFNLCNTVTVKNLLSSYFLKIVLIDSWDLKKQNKSDKFPAQAVSLPGQLVPNE